MSLRTISFAMVSLLPLLSGNVAVFAQNTTSPGSSLPLELVQTIPLPDVTGGMNHLDADAKRQRFYVTAPAQQKVVVVDLKARKALLVLDVPAAAARFIPDRDELCVAGHSAVTFFEGNSLKPNGKVDLGASCDELQYEPKEKRLYVGVTATDKPSIAVVDVPGRKLLARIKLPAAPQGFVVETKGNRIFVNTPGKAQVTVVDCEKQSVVAEWKLSGARSNYPIALDEAKQRLFVACRRAAKLLVLDTKSGKIIDSVETGGDADDMSFDAADKRVYVICGSGVISTVEQIDADHYRKLPDVVTAEDVRNAQFIGPLKRLYVAVPSRKEAPAELRVYRPQDSTFDGKNTR